MYVVVGLGNPGSRYTRTRHNVGFLVVERLSQRWSIPLEKRQFGALTGDGALAGQKAILVMPQQFMNLSGQAVSSILGFYKLGASDLRGEQQTNLLVAHDDMDLPFGRLRLRVGGGHGGHNGIRDILRLVPTPSFVRVRIGIGRPPEGWNPADYVLSNWTMDEAPQIDDVVDRAADAIESVLRDGLAAAMNRFNSTSTNPTNPGPLSTRPQVDKP